MKLGILDLGTNTFNLIIVDARLNSQFTILHEKKIAVKLGSRGINSGIIIKDAYSRALDAVKQHKQILNQFEVEKVAAYATSAIRSAQNGERLIRDIQEKYGISPQIISGDLEAELIYHGVKLALPFKPEKPILIMDIGGGSVEFVISDHAKILWRGSYKIGVARLLEKIKPSNPISYSQINNIKDLLHTELDLLFKAIDVYKPVILVGSSGSFDTFIDLLYPENRPGSGTAQASTEIGIEDFQLLYNTLVNSSLEERLAMQGMPDFRAEMIVLAIIEVQYIVERANIKRIIQSAYALKEGAIHLMIQDNG
ncbi:MAG: phosphatase [Bacteroidota bacterium]|nr:phosphatase [Bacteroidota bacterium]